VLSALVRVSCGVVLRGRWLCSGHRLAELRSCYARVLAGDTAAEDAAAVTQLLAQLPGCEGAQLLRAAAQGL